MIERRPCLIKDVCTVTYILVKLRCCYEMKAAVVIDHTNQSYYQSEFYPNIQIQSNNTADQSQNVRPNCQKFNNKAQKNFESKYSKFWLLDDLQFNLNLKFQQKLATVGIFKNFLIDHPINAFEVGMDKIWIHAVFWNFFAPSIFYTPGVKTELRQTSVSSSIGMCPVLYLCSMNMLMLVFTIEFWFTKVRLIIPTYYSTIYYVSFVDT